MATSKAAPSALIATAPLSEPLRALAHAGEVRRYAKGTLLIQEGDQGDTLYIILAGQLRAYSSLDTGEREITYGVYGPGEYVGEMGLDGGPRAANVIALQASVCARVERATLQAYIAAQPDFAFELLSKVIRRARAATMGLKQIALNDVYGRLKLLLESLATTRGDGSLCVPGPLTHRDIAQRLGCGREMVSRVMKELERGGYLEGAGVDLVMRRALPPRW
jgi:CRP/FNR family transcriptional regulator, cyclic AMP receptor protein